MNNGNFVNQNAVRLTTVTVPMSAFRAVSEGRITPEAFVVYMYALVNFPNGCVLNYRAVAKLLSPAMGKNRVHRAIQCLRENGFLATEKLPKPNQGNHSKWIWLDPDPNDSMPYLANPESPVFPLLNTCPQNRDNAGQGLSPKQGQVDISVVPKTGTTQVRGCTDFGDNPAKKEGTYLNLSPDVPIPPDGGEMGHVGENFPSLPDGGEGPGGPGAPEGGKAPAAQRRKATVEELKSLGAAREGKLLPVALFNEAFASMRSVSTEQANLGDQRLIAIANLDGLAQSGMEGRDPGKWGAAMCKAVSDLIEYAKFDSNHFKCKWPSYFPNVYAELILERAAEIYGR